VSRCQSSRPGVNDPEDAKAYASASLAGNGGARTRCPAWSGCGTGSRLAHLRHQPGQRHLRHRPVPAAGQIRQLGHGLADQLRTQIDWGRGYIAWVTSRAATVHASVHGTTRSTTTGTSPAGCASTNVGTCGGPGRRRRRSGTRQRPAGSQPAETAMRPAPWVLGSPVRCLPLQGPWSAMRSAIVWPPVPEAPPLS
jgi:hypothetical protein